MPDRADGVDDVLGGELVAFGETRLTRGAAADRAAFLQQLRPRRRVDRAVDSPAAQERFIRGVHDRVDLERS